MYRNVVSGIILHRTDVSINGIHDSRRSKDKIKQLTVERILRIMQSQFRVFVTTWK
jgi:hypothetical protein